MAALIAGPALCATPITHDFALGSKGCGADAIGTAITVAQSNCAPQGSHQYLTAGASLTRLFASGTTFDYLALNTLVWWQEIFAIPAANLPAGLNPASQSGHDALWRANDWALATNPLPILHTRGYNAGALIADWNPPLIDT